MSDNSALNHQLDTLLFAVRHEVELLAPLSGIAIVDAVRTRLTQACVNAEVATERNGTDSPYWQELRRRQRAAGGIVQ